MLELCFLLACDLIHGCFSILAWYMADLVHDALLEVMLVRAAARWRLL